MLLFLWPLGWAHGYTKPPSTVRCAQSSQSGVDPYLICFLALDGMMIFLFLAFAGVAVAGSLNFVYPLIWYSKGGTAAGAFFFPLSLSGLVQHIGARAVPGGAFDVERNGTAPGYSWADLYDLRFSPTVLREDATRELGTLPVHMIAFLVGDIVLGLWFAWYFDTVWPGDKGVPESFFFFFKPSVRSPIYSLFT